MASKNYNDMHMPVRSSKESPGIFLCTSLLTPPITLPKSVLPRCRSVYYNFLYVHHVRDMVGKLTSPCRRAATLLLYYKRWNDPCQGLVDFMPSIYFTSSQTSSSMYGTLHNIYMYGCVGIPHALGIRKFQQLSNQLLPPHILVDLCVCVYVFCL